MIWLAILAGLLTPLILRLTTRPGAIRDTVREIEADLLEFRLYFDEPRLVWQAQMNLIRDNLRLGLLFLPAVVIVALPVSWLILHHHAPHAEGDAVFTIQLTRPIAATDRFELRGGAGVQVETPPLRIPHDRQVSWRIRVGHGPPTLNVTINGHKMPDGDIARMGIIYPPGETSISWLIEFLLVSSAAALLSAILLYY